jgi:hypothetical protein
VRQQIKWITLAAVALAVCQVAGLLGIAATGTGSNPATIAAFAATPVIALYGIPALITVAILKHGLYEIDVVINRALRYGLLSAALTAIYVGIVVGIGTLAGYAGGPLLTAAAALAIAVLFQPLRRRAQLAANRIVYGQRATPYQVLADFAEDMAGQLDADAALDRMSTVLAGATGAVRVQVWVRVGPQLRARVTWPHGSTPPPPSRSPAATGSRSSARRGRSPSATPMSCSARSPLINRKMSQFRPPRTSCWPTWRRRRAWCCVTSASPPSCRPPSTTCGRRGGGWSGPRTRNGSASNGTCTTAPSNSSSRS